MVGPGEGDTEEGRIRVASPSRRLRHGTPPPRTRLADTLAKKTPLHKGITRRWAAGLLFVLTGPALYRDFVLEAGWAPRDWMRWVSGTLIRDLPPDQ